MAQSAHFITSSLKVLSPKERASEVLYGLLMVLTVTGSLSAATPGRAEIHTMLFGAVGSNLAWGLVDAIIYLVACLDEQYGEGNPHPRLRWRDWGGAIGVFFLVFSSVVPVVLPFALMRDAMHALRVSNGIAVAMLFATGYAYGSAAGRRPWRAGLSMVLLGGVLVAITLVLGG